MLIHNNQIVELSIADLLSKYKQGQLSVLSFVESSLERIERLDRQGPTLTAGDPEKSSKRRSAGWISVPERDVDARVKARYTSPTRP